MPAHLHTAYIMTSNLNNAMTFTIDDYFRRRMFDGDIIKTQNLMNQPLQAYCPTPDSLKKEQDRIEKQLVSFEDSLWMKPDTTLLKELEANQKGKKAKAKEAKVKETKTEKVKAPKAQKAPRSTGAVRSVRRR